ncbi:hypothetical protein KEM52_006172 [Ascosphaera acerosa]|nr:hypothetical protein KEM52_006172 [Ascosphaera acerosa]
MGKPKKAKARVPFYNHHDGPARTRKRRELSPARPSARKQQQQQQQQGKATKQSAKGQQKVQRNQLPVIPFRKSDRILLVGEGDFSFARSLIRHHGCERVLATCFDSEQTLHEKYPQAGPIVDDIVACNQSDAPLPAPRHAGGHAAHAL